jgi:formate hydrogenlyase subunit 4
LGSVVVGDGVRLRIVATRTDDPYQELTWVGFRFRSKSFPDISSLQFENCARYAGNWQFRAALLQVARPDPDGAGMKSRILFNLLQVITVMACSPLVAGVLARLKENVQSKRGPSIFQPYRDLWKLFHKDEVVSQDSSWIFRLTPYPVFVAPIFVTLLIPVLTAYPLFLAFMGDMLGGGFVLALGGFFAALAAVDTANPYGAMGASRTRMVGFLAEPVFMIVFFTVSFIAGSTIPYIVQKYWVTPLTNFFEPAHVLLVLAFLMLILAEAGRIPVDNPSGHFELAMIDESKTLEYSGVGAALMKWGGHMKLFVLMCIFLNVVVAPWGLASSMDVSEVLLAVALVLVKILCLVLVIVAIESTLAKLRLFRISEFLGAAFITCVAAMITQFLKT